MHYSVVYSECHAKPARFPAPYSQSLALEQSGHGDELRRPTSGSKLLKGMSTRSFEDSEGRAISPAVVNASRDLGFVKAPASPLARFPGC